jgi:hypothetical protein
MPSVACTLDWKRFEERTGLRITTDEGSRLGCRCIALVGARPEFGQGQLNALAAGDRVNLEG